MARTPLVLAFLVVTGAISFCQSSIQESGSLAGTPHATQPSSAPAILIPCGPADATNPGCNPSAKELKQAKAAFASGLKLQHTRHRQAAFDAFDKAAHLAPKNVEYLTARELARQQLVFDDVQHGNAALSQGRQTEALADFHNALEIDPKNDFAQQQLNELTADGTAENARTTRVLENSRELRLEPDALKASFHYRGNGTDLLTQVARAFGVTPMIDESVVSRPVEFDVDDVDFYSAMQAATAVTHTFWTPLQSKQILIAAESADNHKKFDRMALRTFYVAGINTPTDLTTIVSMLRNLFDIKFITPNMANSTLTVRAPQDTLDAATRVLEGLDSDRPEIMVEMRVYQIDHTFMRNIGLQIPNQFQLYNIPAAALLALGGQNLQNLINQLISSGGINQANSQAVSALLAQLQSQAGSIFSQPLATFGGGNTFEGLSLGTLGAQLSMNENWVKEVQDLTVRVSQGEETTLKVGSRYPILNAIFAPIFNSSAISQVIQNNSFQAPFPSFTYEDLGISMKIKPNVYGDSAIGMHLEMQLKTLAGPSSNGVPVIANREFQGSLTLVEGTPAVIAGAVTRSEQKSLTGIPGLGDIPGLNQVMASNSDQEEDDELLIVLTPRVIRQTQHRTATEVWLAR